MLELENSGPCCSQIQIVVLTQLIANSRFWSTQDELPWLLSGVLPPTVSTHFSSKSIIFGDLLNKHPPSQWLILPKSGEMRGAIFTSETENGNSAKAPR